MKNKILLTALTLALFTRCQKEFSEPQQPNEPPQPQQFIPVLFEPADSTKDYFRNANYRWSEIPGAEKYEVQVSKNNDFSQLYDSAQVTAAQFVSRTLLSTNAAYYWRVRTRADGEWKEWSDTATFKVGLRYNLPDDFRKRYEGTYILRDSVYGLYCAVYNPPGAGPWCAEYGNFSYLANNDTLVVQFSNDNSLRIDGQNLQDTSGYIFLNGQDGIIHSNGAFSGFFTWSCTSRHLNGYFRNDSLVYTYLYGDGGCSPIYTKHFYSGRRQ